MSTAFLGEPGAQLLLSPNQGGLGDASQKRWVCVHGTGGFSSASDVANYFGSPSSQVSSTYIVGLDGEYYQCVSENESAWANGGVTGIPKIGGIGLPVYGDGVYRDPWWTQSLNPNRVTISIEHVKVSRDNSDSLTPPQQKTSMWLIYNVCKRWSIPMRPADALGGITGHYSMDAINRPRCPGPYSWDDLFAYCNQRQQEETMLTIQQAANYFTSSPDGVYWTAKSTGYVIGHAILQFYRQFGASAYCGLTYLGLPLSNELDAGVGGGITYQRFERGVLGYDPQHKLDTPPGAGDVYVLHLDKGIGQDPRLATLQQQLLAVQAQYVALKNAQAQTVPTIAALTKNQQIVTQIKQLADQFVIS